MKAERVYVGVDVAKADLDVACGVVPAEQRFPCCSPRIECATGEKCRFASCISELLNPR